MRRSFRFDKEKMEYTLQVKRRRWWWWLLLLPLLLLIKCEKTITVVARDTLSGGMVPGMEVQLTYPEHFVFDSGKFFTGRTVKKKAVTDKEGRAVFQKLRYSLYAYIFHHAKRASVFGFNNCYASDTFNLNYHGIKNNSIITLPLKPAFITLDFKVVDADDKEPLPGARVTLQTTVSGQALQTQELVSGPDGIVVFKQVPKCGAVSIARATAVYYHPDSIVNKTVEAISSGAANPLRLLQLKPVRKPIVFYVKDCNTGTGLADVDAALTFTYPGTRKSLKEVKVRTNINGVGKGVYDSAELIASVQIRGSRPYYKDGALPGTHPVKGFINYDSTKRTFCLQPEPNPIIFKNVDSVTKKPIPGIRNEITISNGGRTTKKEVISDQRGDFGFSVNPGDRVSIHAKDLRGYYEDNNYTIKEVDGIGLLRAPADRRIVPMKPVLKELLFRVVDEDSGKPLPEADVKISGDGFIEPVSEKTNSDGSFRITAALMSRISIVASKAGYGINDAKINNKSVEFLVRSDQPDRDIPLKKNVPPAVCNGVVKPRTRGTFEQSFDLEDSNARFRIEYNMQAVPDEIRVYCGSSVKGKLIWKSGYQWHDANGPGSVSPDIDLVKQGCGSSVITIQIEPKPGNDPNSSAWSFTIKCL